METLHSYGTTDTIFSVPFKDYNILYSNSDIINISLSIHENEKWNYEIDSINLMRFKVVQIAR